MPKFLIFCKFFQLFRNVQKFGIIRQKQRIVVSILSVIYYVSYENFVHRVIEAIGFIFVWQMLDAIQIFFFLNDTYYVTYHRLICDVVIGCPIIYNLSESCSVKLIEESAYAIKWNSKYQFHSGSWLSNHHVYHIYVHVYHIYVRWIIMYIIYMFAD